jgi:hypothetical protein
MLTHGLGSEEGCEKVASSRHGKNYFYKTVKPNASKVFASTEEEAAHSDDEFAIRMMLRTIYSQPSRRLQLGTIITSEDNYKICVQPACDSVRLTGRRAFPFLQLSIAGPSKRTSFVVNGEEAGSWVRLLLSLNPRDITMIEFDPGQERAIKAVETNGKYIFTDAQGVVYDWVGILKTEVAQKVAVDLAQQFAQVGVDEAELVRLSRR